MSGLTEAARRPAAWRAALTLAIAVALMLAHGAAGARASSLEAAGPLAFGQSYVGQLAAQTENDFFYFYVTSAEPTQVVIAIENLGGGETLSRISVAIENATGTPTGASAYSIGRGESRTVTAVLEPQKYLVEVEPNENFGDSYRLTTGGGEGAFGPYAAIAERCARARSVISRTRSRLSKRQARHLRATAQLRRSRYGTPRARRRARRAHRRIRLRLIRDRARLRAARRAQSPWCSIPQ